MSPTEVELEFEAAIERVTDDRKRDISMAWQINRLLLLAWNGKLPPLAELLGGAVQSGRQSGAQVASTLHAMAAMYGVPVKYGKAVGAHV